MILDYSRLVVFALAALCKLRGRLRSPVCNVDAMEALQYLDGYFH
jgi:hypothetical protein